MTRVCLFVVMLLSASWAAAGQTPPVPSIPPVPSTPPVPSIPPVPSTPPVPPLPPVAPVAAPKAPRLVEPVFVDSLVIEDALRASRDALRLVDIDGVVDQAIELATQKIGAIDLEDLKAKAKQSKIDVDQVKEQVKQISKSIDVDAIKAQAKAAADLTRQSIDVEAIKEQAREMQDRAFELKNFTYEFQDRGPGPEFRFNSRGPDNNAYDSGMNAIQRRQYDQAITRFDQAIAQKGTHADGAMYWKAFAQWKLGRTQDALTSLADLRRAYGQSHYLNDARVLEADVRKSSGQPMNTDASDDEIKLLALSAMQNSDPERAIPLIENVLKASNSLNVKKRALFLVAQNDRPAAHQILMSYAKGGGNPDLQMEAIRYLGDRKQQTTGTELQDIYNSTQDPDIRRAVLDAFVASGNKGALLRVFTGDSSPDLKRVALSNLGRSSLMTPQELMQLYQKEENQDLRMTMVRSLGSMEAISELQQVIKTEKVPAVRQQAIRGLGNMKPERTGQALVDLYAGEQDKDTRKAIISALGNQNNADGLIAIARKETSDLKVDIVRRIAELAPKNKAAMDFLVEQIK